MYFQAFIIIDMLIWHHARLLSVKEQYYVIFTLDDFRQIEFLMNNIDDINRFNMKNL